MPLGLQTRLLRVLEEREITRVGSMRPIPVDVRVISATHCDLETRVKEGKFRADLYFRLAVLRLHLPTLRERSDDLPALAEWCLKHALAGMGARPHPNLQAELASCAALLSQYNWPGNVRELRNLMERLALFLAAEPLQALTPGFVAKILPELGSAVEETPLETSVSRAESLEQVLEKFKQNREAAADYLGISRTTLWRRLKK